MSEKKIINLDALIDEGQDVLIGGKTYKLRDASVVQLLDFARKAESVNDLEKLPLVIDLLYGLCEEAKEMRAFDSLNMAQVQYLLDNFIMSRVENPVSESVHQAISSEESSKKK